MHRDCSFALQLGTLGIQDYRLVVLVETDWVAVVAVREVERDWELVRDVERDWELGYDIAPATMTEPYQRVKGSQNKS